MIWWDFSNSAFLAFFVIMLSVIVIIILFIVSYIIFQHYQNNGMKKLKKERSTVRIYCIEVKNNLVTYFNRSDLKTKKEVDLSAFYSQFHPNDVERIKNWIFSICVNSQQTEEYIEADVMSSTGKRLYFSLLHFLKYDANRDVIHIESHLLKYIFPVNSSNKKKHNNSNAIVKRSQMEEIINKSRSVKGYTFGVRFFYLKQNVIENDKVERYMCMTLKNDIYPLVADSKHPRRLLEINQNELMLFDLRIETQDEASKLALYLENALKKTIEVNGFFGKVSFAIGVIENAQYYQQFDVIYKRAQEACLVAQQNNKTILFYTKKESLTLDLHKYALYIESLMRPGNMRFMYRPIVDASNSSILGYFNYVRAYNAPFTSFQEMCKYAAKVKKNKDFFAYTMKKVITKFASEKLDSNHRLFINVSLVDSDHIDEIISQIPSSQEAKLCFVFDEQEINENSNSLKLVDVLLKKLHASKYELALLLNDRNLLLEPQFYNNFDYFVAGAAMIGEIRRNNRIRLSIHTLIESLLKYNKTIIATDLESWQSIELIIKSGITIISSDVISGTNDMLLPIETKKMDKLVAFDDNYH